MKKLNGISPDPYDVDPHAVYHKYIPTYEGSPSSLSVGEFNIPIPVKPKPEHIINSDLPPDKQKWQRTVIPVTLRKKRKTNEYQNRFIEHEWHKRRHGVWVRIKGVDLYFPGTYYTFLNYWTMKDGKKPEFRYCQYVIFLVWDFVVRHLNYYGLLLIKPRRVGGTEISLFLMWEKISRTRGATGGMQSKNNTSAKKNYKRLLFAQNNMIWFFKPQQRGSTGAQEELEFRYPETRINQARVIEESEIEDTSYDVTYADPELNSSIDYQSSVASAYDGERLERYILSEFGKIDDKIAMSPNEALQTVIPCLHLDSGRTIIGKAFCESSIEDLGSGDFNSLQESIEMWNQSDPAILDENGRTLNGLVRLFIDALMGGSTDAFGFPMIEENRQFIENQIAALRKRGQAGKIVALRRKSPITIEDALRPKSDQSSFNQEKINEAVGNSDPLYNEGRSLTIQGDFMWQDGVRDSRVIFVRSDKGKWLVSHLMPSAETNLQDVFGGFRVPGSKGRFVMGVDPYDQKDTVGTKRSDGGGVVFRKFDYHIDGLKVDGEGMPEDGGLMWETHRPVATYCARPENPEFFYEDMLLAAVYYGCEVLFENNKLMIKKHFVDRGYRYYLMDRPKAVDSINSANHKGEPGVPANEMTIKAYFDMMTIYVEKYWNCIRHHDLLRQLMTMNYNNRGQHDLGVAFGWALLADSKKYEEKKPEAVNQHWFSYEEV